MSNLSEFHSTILLTINGESFLLESKTTLTTEIKDHIEALCRCAYDDDSEFAVELAGDPGGKTIYDLNVYELAEVFERVVKTNVGIDVAFKGIDLEVNISE